MKCRHAHDAEATGIWHMPYGCICFTDTVQALCTQHAIKAQGNGIEMYLLEDLIMTDEVKTEEKKPEGWYPGKGVEAVGGAIVDNPGGAVAGGLVGTLIFPGVGTAIGVGVGAWWAKKRKERQERLAAIKAGTVKPE